MTDPIHELALCCVRHDDPVAFLAILDALEEADDPRVHALRALDFTKPLSVERVHRFRNTVVNSNPTSLIVLHSGIGAGRGAFLPRGSVLPLCFAPEARERLITLGAVGPASMYAVDPEGSHGPVGWRPSWREARGSSTRFRRPQPDDLYHCRQEEHVSNLVGHKDTPFDATSDPRNLYRAVLITQFPHLAAELSEES